MAKQYRFICKESQERDRHIQQVKFIDFFAGIGGFRAGMELAGHKCVGFCEFDKFAIASYTSMYLLTQEQREYLATLPLKKRRKEILKEEYKNGEWYANDIRTVDARSLPKADCWCFGAPCQDFSIAGKRAGLDGDRSSLIREIFRLLEEQEEKSRPEWLIYENVKGMFSSNGGLDYLSILSKLDELGYDIEWQNINSAWFVPQNRERIYTIGHLRRYGFRKILPIERTSGENRISIIGHRNGYRRNMQICNVNPSGRWMNRNVYDSHGVSPTLTTNKGEGNKIAIPILTPDRAKKRQNGRRFKGNGEPMFTLTTQDRHGIGIEVIGECPGKGFEMRKRIYSSHGIAPCLNGIGSGGNTEPKITIEVPMQHKENGIYVKLPKELTVYAIWNEKFQCYVAIRKLTPKECFRLQRFDDYLFERAQFVNSDNQLYKQAGNSVTVPVVREIGERIRRMKINE